jgi:hypothetical protein
MRWGTSPQGDILQVQWRALTGDKPFREKFSPNGTDVRFGSNRYRIGLSGHVRFAPGSDRIADIPDRQLRANPEVPWLKGLKPFRD